MKKEFSDLIQYRITRARESIHEAKILADSGHWNASVNRLYYSCFYSVLALLIKHSLSSAKHTGVRSLFNKNFVKTGIIPKEIAYIYNSLFERRQEGDYDDYVVFSEKEVLPWIKQTELFIETVINHIA
jgi:uncharacterized protein (UPF0332 family)